MASAILLTNVKRRTISHDFLNNKMSFRGRRLRSSMSGAGFAIADVNARLCKIVTYFAYLFGRHVLKKQI